jgi:hypothetical protein
MSVCARVSLVMEVKVNLIRCDISGGAREWRHVLWRIWYMGRWGRIWRVL